jgi:hypothetical protein
MKYLVTLEDGEVVLPTQGAAAYGAWFDQLSHKYVFVSEVKGKRLTKIIVKHRDF